MTIIELKEMMNNDTDINLEEVLEMRTYIPVAEKKIIIEMIIDKISNTQNGFLALDSVQEKIELELAMVKYHTNLDAYEEDYDCLYEYIDDGVNLHDLLTSCYRRDYVECAKMLRLAKQDLLRNNSIEASIAQLCNKASESLNTISATITDKANNFNLSDILPNGIKAEDIITLVEKYAK